MHLIGIKYICIVYSHHHYLWNFDYPIVKSIPLNNNYFLVPQVPGNHCSTFYLHESDWWVESDLKCGSPQAAFPGGVLSSSLNLGPLLFRSFFHALGFKSSRLRLQISMLSHVAVITEERELQNSDLEYVWNQPCIHIFLVQHNWNSPGCFCGYHCVLG